MAKKLTDRGAFIVPPQSGADLRAWRLLVGLLAREVAELIGVSERSVLRAERSVEPRGEVLVEFERLQARLLEGRLDIRPVLRRRWSRGRATKTKKTATTGHSPRKTAGKKRKSEGQKNRKVSPFF